MMHESCMSTVVETQIVARFCEISTILHLCSLRIRRLIGIPIINLRRLSDRLRFKMGIFFTCKTVSFLIIKAHPAAWYHQPHWNYTLSLLEELSVNMSTFEVSTMKTDGQTPFYTPQGLNELSVSIQNNTLPLISAFLWFTKHVLIGKCKRNLTPLLKHWIDISLGLCHQ